MLLPEGQPAGLGPTVRAVAERVLVIGLGNPILGDDGVGWAVARRLGELEGWSASVEIDCLAVGGLSLMERILGYESVILVDAIETRCAPPGTVTVMDLADLTAPALGHTASAHDASLATALEAARAMGADVPRRVQIVAVEAAMSYDFTEELSGPVAAAVLLACDRVRELIPRR